MKCGANVDPCLQSVQPNHVGQGENRIHLHCILPGESVVLQQREIWDMHKKWENVLDGKEHEI